MRALHFGRFFRPYFGGLERHVLLLLRGLSKQIPVSNVVAANRCWGDVVRADGFDVFRVPSFGTIAGTAIAPSMPIVARRLVKEYGFDIVHLHLPDPLAHLSAMCLPSSVKLVLSWHSDVVRQRRLLQVYHPFLQKLLARADAIIGATPNHLSSSTQLPQWCREKYVTIPYGIDYESWWKDSYLSRAAEIRRQYGNRNLIFAVGRHVYYKGYEYLIRAMAKVDDSVLVLGGCGPMLDWHRKLVRKLRLEHRVKLPGRLSEEELRSHYHAADVFCLPSVEPSEAFGIVQLEAMGCRKPIVCCHLGNGVNYVHVDSETGIAVPPRDPAALGNALNRLNADPKERARLGDGGYRRATQKFTLPGMCEGTLSVYRRILGQ